MAGRTCMEAALSKLNYRMRSREELRGILDGLGYESDEISETLDELESFGYVNDHHFCEEFIRSASRKNWSSSRMIRALRDKGISPELAAETMNGITDEDGEEISPSFYDRKKAMETGLKMADEQLRKSGELDERFMGKVGRRLMSLGYDSSTCYYVIGALRKRSGERNEEEDVF